MKTIHKAEKVLLCCIRAEDVRKRAEANVASLARQRAVLEAQGKRPGKIGERLERAIVDRNEARQRYLDHINDDSIKGH